MRNEAQIKAMIKVLQKANKLPVPLQKKVQINYFIVALEWVLIEPKDKEDYYQWLREQLGNVQA